MAKKKAVKAPAKKKNTPVKKAGSAKVITKKAPTKKVAAKKSAVKKAALKKVSNKKAVVKKTVRKTPVSKKAATKKQAVPVRSKPKSAQAKPIPVTAIKQPGKIEEKAVNNNIVHATSNAAGNELTVTKTEDPLNTFDKHEFQKATSKGDPRSKLHLNRTSKSAIRRSGKKPLW